MVQTINVQNGSTDYTTAGTESANNSSAPQSTSVSNNTNSLINVNQIRNKIAPFWYVGETFNIGTTLSNSYQISFKYDIYLSSLAFEITGTTPVTFYISANGSLLQVNDQNANAGQNFNTVNFSLPDGYFAYIPKGTPIIVFASCTSATTGHIAFNGIKSL